MLVDASVLPGEGHRRGRVGAQDGAAHQQAKARPRRGVDGVLLPGHDVVVGAGEQEHPVRALKGGGDRVRPGQVTLDDLDAERPQGVPGLRPADHGAHRLTLLTEQAHQLQADLAAAADDQDHGCSKS